MNIKYFFYFILILILLAVPASSSIVAQLPSAPSVEVDPIAIPKINALNQTMQTQYAKTEDLNLSEWNTAYSWGNHATAGYLTSHQSLTDYARLDGATFTGHVTAPNLNHDYISQIDTDFSEYTTGTFPEGWIGYGSTPNAWLIIDDATAISGKAIQMTTQATASAYAVLYPDDVLADDGEFEFSYKSTSTSGTSRRMGNIIINSWFLDETGSEINENLRGYQIRIDKQNNNPRLLLSRVDFGELYIGTTLAFYDGISGLDILDWIDVKVLKEGGRIRIKAWQKGSAEPADWQIDYTDPNPLPAGKYGIMAHHFGGNQANFDFLKVNGTTKFYDDFDDKVTRKGNQVIEGDLKVLGELQTTFKLPAPLFVPSEGLVNGRETGLHLFHGVGGTSSQLDLVLDSRNRQNPALSALIRSSGGSNFRQWLEFYVFGINGPQQRALRLNHNRNARFYGDLQVDGTSLFRDDVEVDGDLDVDGNVNISGISYASAFVSHSPLRMGEDSDVGYTRICHKATNGDVVLQSIQLINGTYQTIYVKDTTGVCDIELPIFEATTSELMNVNGEAKFVETKVITHETLYTKEQRTEIIKEIRDAIPKYEIGIEYHIGQYFTYNGTAYEVLQEHTSQEDWLPNELPALYKKLILHEYNEITAWVQPQGAHDCYPLGAIVTYNSKTYQSQHNCNVWQPPTLWSEI